MARMKKKTIPFKFADKHIDYIRACALNTFNFAEGAVRAGKTVDNVYAFAHEIKSTKDKIHLATGSTVANAKLNIGDANGFGLEYIFRGQCHWGKYKDNEALFIKGPVTGKRQRVVIFAGGAKADSYKKIRGNSYGMWIATEINLHHDNTIKEAFNRQLAADMRKIFWDLNPDNPNAKIYTEYIDRYEQLDNDKILIGGYNYCHFTIHDNINITDQRKQEILSQYTPGTIWYLRDIEGRRCVAEGLIYDMFASKKHVINSIPEKLTGNAHVSCDYGTQNPMVFLLWQEGISKTWYCSKEYYYCGRDEKKQKTDSEYCDDLAKFIGDTRIKNVVIDPSAASFIAEIEKRGFKVKKAKNDVLNGIRATGTALEKQRIKFLDCCEETLKEFGSYIWDEKAVESGNDKPVKDFDHAMDAIRYFVYTILDRKSLFSFD